MTRKLAAFSLFVVLWIAAPAQAGQTMKEALAWLPEDAIGFACVPSMKQLDADYQQAIVDLQVQAMVPPPFNSVLAMIRQNVPVLAGMDEEGPLAIVMMPAETAPELGQKVALMVQAKEPKAMIEKAGGQPTETGAWSVNLLGQRAYAAVGERHVILSQYEATAKQVATSKRGLYDKLEPGVRQTLEGLDKAIWLDTGRLFKIAEQQIRGMVSMLMMMQSAQGPVQAKQAEAMKKQIDMAIDGMSSLALGLGLDRAGLGLRFAMTAKSGTEFSENLQVKTTTDSLLRGVPAGNYILAIGQLYKQGQLKESMKFLDPYMDMLTGVDGLDPEQVQRLKTILEEWFPMCTGFRGTVEVLEPGAQGLFGVSFLLDSSNSNRWLELAGQAVEAAQALVAKAQNENIDEQVKEIVGALSFKTGAEEIGHVKTAHLKFDAAALADNEEWIGQLHKIVGKDGLLLRMGAVNDNLVALAFGGGSDYMQRVVEAARSKDAPLENDPGISKVSQNLTPERGSVLYLAADQIVAAINNVARALDEEQLPIKMPDLRAPLAVSGTGGDGWSRADVFIPKELLLAAKNSVMSMMSGPAQQPPAPPSAPTPPPSGGR